MRLIAAVVIVTLLSPGVAVAQGVAKGGPPQGGPHIDENIWSDFSSKIDIGSELKVRLVDGTSFNATLVRVDQTGLLLQPRTRVPVPVQPVAYDTIASLAPVKKGGIGAGKAIAIGVGTGVAAFWGMFAVVVALWAD